MSRNTKPGMARTLPRAVSPWTLPSSPSATKGCIYRCMCEASMMRCISPLGDAPEVLTRSHGILLSKQEHPEKLSGDSERRGRMGAQIELVRGDMFDGPSDLVVIPCSTLPSITWFVAEHLQSFRIPGPQDEMEPGEVTFADLRRASNIAQVAAYAASVRAGRGSSSSIIEQIGQRLGTYAADNPWLGQISCPLLGTGAGMLEPTEAARAIAAGFLATAPERALLRLFVLEDTADSIGHSATGST